MYYFSVIFCVISSILISSEISVFSGIAYNEHKEHIFTEEYSIEKDQNKILSVKTRFLSPKGELLAEMSSDFQGKGYLPEVNFTKKEKTFSYGTTLLEKSIELFKSTSSQIFKKKTLPIKDNMVAGHGFYFFILDKLDVLLAGETMQMIFLQPNRLNIYTFNAKASKEPQSEDLIRIHLTIDNRFLKAFVPEIQLVIDHKTKTLVSYEGLSGFLSEDSSLKTISVQYTPMKLVSN